MDTKYFPLLSRILALFLLHSLCLVLVHAHDPQKQSPMNFLKPLVGIQKTNSTKGLSQLKKYLSNLRYMSYTNANSDTFDDTLEQAIKKYQNFFKLPETGTLDSNTIKQMSKPRCGVPDFPSSPHPRNHSNLNTSSHYTFFPNSPKWAKRQLTYSFSPGTREDAKKAIFYATKMWATVSPLRFKSTPDFDKADIKISFHTGDHRDGNPFDGPGRTLAHAFPPSDGRLHFDGDEHWVYGIVKGAYDIQTVGLHELGHILGLDHSSNKKAIMWPVIDTGSRKFLNKDDIKGIKTLYP